MNLVVRWRDNNGKLHEKEYDQYKQAIKARNYLVKNGATDVDMAVRIKKDDARFSDKS